MGARCFVSAILMLTAVVQAEPEMEDFLEFYCVDCHGDGTEKGGLDLQLVAESPMAEQGKIWEHVILRMESRQMPPPDKDRPTEEEYEETIGDLVAFFDGLAEESPEPGDVPSIRRLTRTEYRHAVRDLLGVTVDVSELLPKDESSHGFDHITVGNLSPTLLNRYVGAAQKIAKVAVGEVQSSPDLRVVRLPGDRSQKEHVEGLPPGTRGGLVFDHHFPVTGEYEFEVRLSRDRNEEVEGLNGTHEMELLLDGAVAESFQVKRPENRDHTKVDAHLKARIRIEGGTKKVGATFVKLPSSLLETNRQPYDAEFNFHRHPRQAPAIFQLSITGPLGEQEVAGTESRKEIFREGESKEAALRRLMRKAYRRPVTEEEVAAIRPFLEEGMEMAVSAILVSPQFLLRVEGPPEGVEAGEVYRLDDFKLATRLSFFLWSSLPDEELLDLAEAGKLSDPAVWDGQVRRMLEDEKAETLVTNFADQWLQLRNLDSFSPDLRMFPDFDDNLRQSFKKETSLFFESILREERSVMDLLKADYTFLNERLARHYGIPHVYGSHFRRVAVGPESHRGGLLRQGSVLAVTSYANRTSPVIRGNWVLENVLGTPAPPPPPNTPTLDEVVVAANLPMRERLSAHRDRKECRACHALMDPVGFSLEQFDAVGRWRVKDGDAPVDASGGLPSGERFEGVDGLEEGLLRSPDLFAKTVTEKLMVYGLGRGVEHYDAPAIRKIVEEASEDGYCLSDLILGVTKSMPFSHRRKL
ncbi:MAG: DUF1592 domain-containing protein [Verrucomicrobiaceae bacterium]